MMRSSMKRRRLLALVLIAIWVWSIPVLHAKKKREPDSIVVQHILIGFKKTIRNKPLDRTKKEAEALAEKLLEQAQAGEDFDALVKEYTDDQYPGFYFVINRDAEWQPNSIKREDLVDSFGDVAFKLEVGEVGLANYHPGSSPYGWHIIKRWE